MVNVALVDGFQPATGDVFDILTAEGGIDGDALNHITFDFSQAALATPGLFWETAIVPWDFGGAPLGQALQLQVVVPEPGSVALPAIAAAVLLLAYRRRK